LISIIIPLYNKEFHIERTLKSVLSQTFQEFEVIIVDDGSTDNSVLEVNKFNDKRIRIISQENMGVSAARNRGIEESKYDFVSFLDADDEWVPDYLNTIHTLIVKYKDCSVYATSYYIDTKGVIMKNEIRGLTFENNGIIDDYFHIASINMPPLWTSAITVKKSALNHIGGFPVGIKSGEDLLTWARLAVFYKIAYDKKCLSIYHDDVEKWEPGRSTDQEDVVGQELKKLFISIGNDRRRSLRKYIGLWHKMRASTFLRHDQRLLTVKEACLSLYYNPFNYKTYLFMFLAFMPSNFYKYILSRA
jgi:glycosyltransferase involved in cell wall biosynthesis